jgi:hypothetical protein
MIKEAEAEQDMEKFERSFAGFPVFPASGRTPTTDMVRKAEIHNRCAISTRGGVSNRQ